MIERGEISRLAIYAKREGSTKLERMAVVPAGTAQTPFVVKMDKNYRDVVLRLNEDEDGDWEKNSGSVTYRVLVVGP